MPSWLTLPDRCPASLTLIAITVACYLAQISTQGAVTELGMLYGPLVQHGQWWRLLSAGFMHGGLLHVAFNMYLLYVLGPQLERWLGSVRFILIYFGAMLGGSLAVMIFDWGQATLGASGAALGLAGAMGVALHAKGVSPRQSPVMGLVVLNLALPLLVPGISFWGHFGGILSGALMGYLLIWQPTRSKNVSLQTSLVSGIATLVVFALAAFMFGRMGGLSI
ncbi:MAG: rhomboid family intramembrane serine protease [Granulosicoccus sp.]